MINVTLGETFRLALQAEDPNDDAIFFEVPNLPSGANFTTTADTLYFSWTVTSADEVCIKFSFHSIKPALIPAWLVYIYIYI